MCVCDSVYSLVSIATKSKSKYLFKTYNKRIRTVQCGCMQTESIDDDEVDDDNQHSDKIPTVCIRSLKKP